MTMLRLICLGCLIFLSFRRVSGQSTSSNSMTNVPVDTTLTQKQTEQIREINKEFAKKIQKLEKVNEDKFNQSERDLGLFKLSQDRESALKEVLGDRSTLQGQMSFAQLHNDALRTYLASKIEHLRQKYDLNSEEANQLYFFKMEHRRRKAMLASMNAASEEEIKSRANVVEMLYQERVKVLLSGDKYERFIKEE